MLCVCVTKMVHALPYVVLKKNEKHSHDGDSIFLIRMQTWLEEEVNFGLLGFCFLTVVFYYMVECHCDCVRFLVKVGGHNEWF